MKRHELINDLVTKLFEPEKRRLSRLISEINTSNKRLKKTKVDGFIYNGMFFTPTEGTLTVAGPGFSKSSLDPSLNETLKRYCEEVKTAEIDKALIRQMLYKLLQHCSTAGEIRNVLPEFLVPLVPDLSEQIRVNEPAYILQSDPRAMQQFEKILPKMEFYAAMRLFC